MGDTCEYPSSNSLQGSSQQTSSSLRHFGLRLATQTGPQLKDFPTQFGKKCIRVLEHQENELVFKLSRGEGNQDSYACALSILAADASLCMLHWHLDSLVTKRYKL
jgi:hypothetical protein